MGKTRHWVVCAPGTQYNWMDCGNVEREVCLTLLHMINAANWTPDFMIYSLMGYLLGDMLPQCNEKKGKKRR